MRLGTRPGDILVAGDLVASVVTDTGVRALVVSATLKRTLECQATAVPGAGRSATTRVHVLVALPGPVVVKKRLARRIAA